MDEVPEEEIKKQFDRLLFQLRMYNKDLNLIIKNKKSHSQLIITANGNPYLFKEVELLVHKAPQINKWKVTAFLQPDLKIEKYENGTDKPLLYKGIELKVSEMYFMPTLNRLRATDFGIIVLLKNFIVHQNNPKLKEAVYAIIEHLVGEKSFANEIAFIELQQLNGNEKPILNLYDLQIYMEYGLPDFYESFK